MLHPSVGVCQPISMVLLIFISLSTLYANNTIPKLLNSVVHLQFFHQTTQNQNFTQQMFLVSGVLWTKILKYSGWQNDQYLLDWLWHNTSNPIKEHCSTSALCHLKIKNKLASPVCCSLSLLGLICLLQWLLFLPQFRWKKHNFDEHLSIYADEGQKQWKLKVNFSLTPLKWMKPVIVFKTLLSNANQLWRFDHQQG